MTVENALDFVTTVHWHGLLVPGNNDGGPQQLIHPGNTWRPVLTVDQAAATLWFILIRITTPLARFIWA